MEYINFADTSDSAAIRLLWDIAFGEERDFNDYFFKNFFDPQKTLVCKINGELAAMTQMLDYCIPSLGAVTYIYGAATLPALRGRGIMTRLLEESFKTDIKNNKAGSVLIPANKGLFDFYARLGYKKAFFVKNAVYAAGHADIAPVGINDAGFLNSIYDSSLQNIPHPIRTAEYWTQQIKMFNALGGFAYRTDTAYAFGFPDGIQELMGENKGILAAGIAKRLNKTEISASEQGYDTPFGMLKPYNKNFDKMYFNLMFN